jgi:hypothetical protein
MWQFANLFQFILLFGKALKMDDSLDIEVCSLAATRSSHTTYPAEFSNALAALGPRNRMPEAWRPGFAGRRPLLPEIHLVTSRLDVLVPSPGDLDAR